MVGFVVVSWSDECEFGVTVSGSLGSSDFVAVDAPGWMVGEKMSVDDPGRGVSGGVARHDSVGAR